MDRLGLRRVRLFETYLRNVPFSLPRAAPYLLLILVGVSLFSVTLDAPPSIQDDMRYLSSVSATDNPLVYLIRDHGHGNYLYRPLTSISIWVAYRLVGVWALPNQVINLLLHLATACLLYKVARRFGCEATLAFLISVVFLASPYTYLAASLVADRPMTLVGFFLALMVLHMTPRANSPSDESEQGSIRPPYLALLSVLALLSKESGLVLPLLALAWAACPTQWTGVSLRLRVRLGLMATAVIIAYLVFRAAIFGSNAVAYEQDGYLYLGLWRYERLSDLALIPRAVAMVENVLKNGLALILPIFGGGGQLLDRAAFLASLPLIVATTAAFGLAVRRPLARAQRLALLLLVANSVAHFTLFRFRLLYPAQFGFCLFLAAAPVFRATPGPQGRLAAVRLLSVVLVLSGVLWVGRAEHGLVLERAQMLEQFAGPPADWSVEVRPQIVEEVLQRYK